MNIYMQKSIEEARKGINKLEGGPFGSVIVKDGKIIAKAHNQVLKNHDATCHGEIQAIRKASQKLATHDLSGCELYTTAEPCNMCLSACIWAKISKIYYGATIQDTSNLGFIDAELDNIFNGREQFKDRLQCLDRKECLKLFDEYSKIKDHTIY